MENVLTIAGSDSLAGGGLQVDLKTFEELDTFGLSAVTSLVTILPQQVHVTPVANTVLAQQLTSILTQVSIRAAKTGLLGGVDAIHTVATQLAVTPMILVVDPVFVFKEGRTDRQTTELEQMKRDLLPLATVVTPNLAEAELLSGDTLTRAEQLPGAAQKIQALGCPNVVIKGGNRLPGNQAVDYLLTPQGEFWFRTLKVATPATNGAGCTFSAAITAWLARGVSVEEAVQRAKTFVRAEIAYGVRFNSTTGSVWQGAWRQHGGQQRGQS